MNAAHIMAFGETLRIVFNPSQTSPALILQKGVTDHILLYRGSFNPPHIGHKLLLNYAFLRTSISNLVAAFIKPSAVKRLEHKIRHEVKQHGADTLVLSKV